MTLGCSRQHHNWTKFVSQELRYLKKQNNLSNPECLVQTAGPGTEELVSSFRDGVNVNSAKGAGLRCSVEGFDQDASPMVILHVANVAFP